MTELLAAIVGLISFGWLFIAYRFGWTAIHSAGIKRSEDPVSFWIGVSIPALGLLMSVITLLSAAF